MIECQLEVRFVVGSIPVPLSVPHMCSKGMYCYVCEMVDIKDILLLSGGSGFPLLLSEWFLIVRPTAH